MYAIIMKFGGWQVEIFKEAFEMSYDGHMIWKYVMTAIYNDLITTTDF